MLVLPLAAFGGGTLGATVALAIGCLMAVAVVRPGILHAPFRFLDGALAGIAGVIVLQLVPLPFVVLQVLSPRAAEVRSAIELTPDGAVGFRALSIDPSATAWAGLITAGALAVFWLARHLFETGGVRRTARAISTTGMAVSLLAIAQAATGGRNIYWIFPTEHEGPLPFGPFINRNHFATWAIMAAPLCFGYIAARSDAHGHAPLTSPRTRIARLIDGRTVWLFVSGATLLAALLLSLSRSGILALAAASAATMALTRRRPDASRYWWFVIAAGGAAGAATLWSDVGAIAERIAGLGVAVEGRVRIWRDTLPILRDFWMTGTGAGTYQRAMLLYQQSDRLWYFNQAHNHYLQIAAEGGLLLCAAAATAFAAYLRRAFHHLVDDRSGMFWLRAGALCGLGAVALQSLWETGLTMPANAVLAAILAAVVVHQRHGDPRG